MFNFGQLMVLQERIWLKSFRLESLFLLRGSTGVPTYVRASAHVRRAPSPGRQSEGLRALRQSVRRPWMPCLLVQEFRTAPGSRDERGLARPIPEPLPHLLDRTTVVSVGPWPPGTAVRGARDRGASPANSSQFPRTSVQPVDCVARSPNLPSASPNLPSMGPFGGWGAWPCGWAGKALQWGATRVARDRICLREVGTSNFPVAARIHHTQVDPPPKLTRPRRPPSITVACPSRETGPPRPCQRQGLALRAAGLRRCLGQ